MRRQFMPALTLQRRTLVRTLVQAALGVVMYSALAGCGSGSSGSSSATRTVTDLGNQFVATSINDQGQIVGGRNGAVGGPVLWQNGTLIDPNTLLPANSGVIIQTAAGINNNGNIVGYATVQGDLKHAYRLK